MAEMQRMHRSKFSRATGSKLAGIFIFKMAMQEKPFMTPTWSDEQGNEYWDIERQFYLKFKNEFLKLGFLPVGRSFINEKF